MRRRLALLAGAWAFAGLLSTGTAVAQAGGAPDPKVEVQQALDLLASDPVEGRRLLERVVETGHPDALNGLAVAYLHGIGGPADTVRAAELFERAAAAGSATAKINLARMLLLSADPAQQTRALRLAEEAAAKDPRLAAAADIVTGLAYVYGWGAPQDPARGLDLIERHPEKARDDGQVRYTLGRAYVEGWGGRAIDLVRAYAHLERAGDLGVPRALWISGMMLLRGEGVAPDAQRGVERVRAAAEAGSVEGMVSTAVFLATGEGGVQVDAAAARSWYDKAARLGSAHALRGLGAMWTVGEGGPVDAARGQAYLELAQEGGDGVAAELLRSLSRRLTADREAIDAIKAEWLAAWRRPS